MAWYVGCASSKLRNAPLSLTLLGTPLVLFRGREGKAAALLDRCAHRNIPLSEGRVVDCRLECRYHGWQYDESGQCAKIPGLPLDAFPRDNRSVPKFATAEQDGFVWIYSTADADPSCRPFILPQLQSGATEVRRVLEVEAPLQPALENFLDVPHTAVLHHGLFRGKRQTRRIKVRVSRTADGVQAEYFGESRPEGWAAKILSPKGGELTHVDRFIMPSIAQIEYRLGESTYFLVNALCVPAQDALTRIFAVIQFRTRMPGWIVKLLLNPIATRIFEQDASILKSQTGNLKRNGGEHYTSTPIDVLGLQIGRLLRDPHASEMWTREIEMDV
jgi:phenylpropionate dioxygenase-like ring-hydroxylating dioxygenase large terminal subunit